MPGDSGPPKATSSAADRDNPPAEEEEEMAEATGIAVEAVGTLQEFIGKTVKSHEIRPGEKGGTELVFIMEEEEAPRIVLSLLGDAGRYSTGQVRIDVGANRGLEGLLEKGIDPLLKELAGEKILGANSDKSGEITVNLSSGMKIVFLAVDARTGRPTLSSEIS